VEGDEDEGLGFGAEANGVRGTDELIFEGVFTHFIEPFFGYDDFGSEAGEVYPSGIEDVGHAFTVTGGAGGDIGENEGPVGAEEFHHVAEGADVGFYFLDGDDIEAGDNLGYVFDGGQVAAGGVFLAGSPDSGQVSEGADVPGGY